MVLRREARTSFVGHGLVRRVVAALLCVVAAVGQAAGPTSRPAGAAADLQLPPWPDDLDLRSVEKLYKSTAYRVEIRPAGAGPYQRCFVFETRNDWVLRDFFGKFGHDPMRVIRVADDFGDEKGQMRTASFTQFSFAHTAVDVRITLLAADAVARTVTVRPLRHAIPATISADGKTVTFTLDRPLKVSVDINDRLDPLFLFDDAPDVPEPEATYYFGPGVHRLAGDGRLTLHSGDHVYIAAGAIVEGRFLLGRDSQNISVRGRGILSTGEWPHVTTDVEWLKKNSTFYSRGTARFTLEGLTLVQGSAWTVAIDDDSGHSTHDNLYANVKMVHWAGNTDAFWITGVHNRVADCFVFNNDDAVVSKGGSDCRVDDLVVWGGAWGRLLLLFNFGRPITGLTLQNVDLIGKGETPVMVFGERLPRKPLIDVRDVTFRNVRIEDRTPPPRPGRDCFVHIDAAVALMRLTNLRFDNVTLDQAFADEGVILGSAAAPAAGVAFKNFRLGGRLVRSASETHVRFNDAVAGPIVALSPDASRP